MTEKTDAQEGLTGTRRERRLALARASRAHRRRRILIFLLIFVLATVAIVGLGLRFASQWSSPADKELQAAVDSHGAIVGGNSDMVGFSQGEKIEGASEKQFALAEGTNATAPAYFLFTNGSPSESKRVLDLYIDFSDQRSRDFVSVNSSVLKTSVEYGVIDLRIHSVQTGDAYSIYASEALAEVMATAPEKAWPLYLDLLKQAPTVDSSGTEAIIESIEQSFDNANVTEADGKSVEQGMFSSWLMTVGDDPQLSKGAKLPLAYLAGEQVPEDVIKNDPEVFSNYLSQE